MIYNAIIVDSANLFYRLKKNSKTSIDIVKKMISYVEGEVKSHLDKNGVTYLLFDPLSYSDLGESKNFYHSLNDRKQILSDYKANRTYSNLYLETIELFRKYYLYRGDKIKLLYSDEYEADDYVEPLIEIIFKPHDLMSYPISIALISNDYDYARYICNEGGRQVHMINEGFDKPFTVEQFEKLFQFKPTIATVILYKALFGDKSDKISGAIFMKKAKFGTNIKIIGRDYLQQVGENKTTLDNELQKFKTANFSQCNNKKNKEPFDLLYLAFNIVDLKVPVFEKLYTNIKVIRSGLAGKSLEPYTHCNPENSTINDVIHKSIYGIPFSSSFGKI